MDRRADALRYLTAVDPMHRLASDRYPPRVSRWADDRTITVPISYIYREDIDYE